RQPPNVQYRRPPPTNTGPIHDKYKIIYLFLFKLEIIH
ncbi:unnamed protein product, partial [Rotaria sp. Silwood1]